MTPIEQMIVTVLCSSGATGLVFKLIEYFTNRHDKKSGCNKEMKNDIEKTQNDITDIKKMLEDLVGEVNELKEDDIVVLHDRIYQAFNYMKKLPNITVPDRANVDYLADRYFNRGGNHDADLS